MVYHGRTTDKRQNMGFLYAHLVSVTTHPQSLLGRVVKTSVLRISDQVRHKPGSTTKENGQRLEILDLESRWIDFSIERTKVQVVCGKEALYGTM